MRLLIQLCVRGGALKEAGDKLLSILCNYYPLLFAE